MLDDSSQLRISWPSVGGAAKEVDFSMQASEFLKPFGNRLLAAMPGKDFERLRLSFEKVSFAAADIVCDAGDQLEYVYFPNTCIASLVYITIGGVTAEMGLIGNEGAIGIAAILGGDTTPNRAVIQIAGSALKIRAEVMRQEFERNPRFRRLLLLYTQALITQLSQTAVCNRLHSVEQRLCRRILLCRDKLQSDEMSITQEFNASMLGCRRQSVTVAAGHLQSAGLIQYTRGQIKILDRVGLERRACECYVVVRTEIERLMEANGGVDGGQ